MLYDRHAGLAKFGDEIPRGIQIHQIVVGKLFALKLFRARESRCRTPSRNVQRRLLVRIFSIAHRLPPLESNVDPLRKLFQRADGHFAIRRQPLEFRCDFPVVPRRARISFARQLQPRRQAQLAFAAQFLRNRSVVCRVGHYPNALKIFGGRTHHGRPADIDVLDQLARRDPRLRRRCRKRIKVYDHQIDRNDSVLCNFLPISRFRALEQNPTVHFGMQRLHAPSQHFRPASELGNISHRDAGLAQKPRRPAG